MTHGPFVKQSRNTDEKLYTWISEILQIEVTTKCFGADSLQGMRPDSVRYLVLGAQGVDFVVQVVAQIGCGNLVSMEDVALSVR